MASTISVPNSLLEKVEALLSSQESVIEILDAGEQISPTISIVEAQGKVESDSSTLQAGGWIKCSTARKVAEKLGVGYKQFGALLDLLEIKVRECELDCF